MVNCTVMIYTITYNSHFISYILENIERTWKKNTTSIKTVAMEKYSTYF